MNSLLISRWLAVAAVCGGALAPSAHALEHITLKTGFAYDCSRHEPVDGGRVRLYLGDSGAANYVDLPAAEIVSVDVLPDPAKTAAPAHSSAASATEVGAMLSHAGAQHNIDVDLLASVIHAESAGHATAVSRVGAQGLMQLMPSTARAMGVEDAFQPEQNINGGTAYLDGLLTRYHDNLALALAAYNAGPGAVDRYHGMPPFRETRAYVVRVMSEFKRRKAQVAHTMVASR